MKKVNLLNRAEMRMVFGGNVDDGTPGGNNGNPCLNGGCEAAGGTMIAHYGDGGTALGNCNEFPYDPTCHNGCFVPAGENFWC